MSYRDQNVILLVCAGLVFAMLICKPGSALAQQQPTLTDEKRYKDGYTFGLDASKRDFQGLSGHGCDPTAPANHTATFQKGYAAGYSKGPCGSTASLSSSNSSKTVPSSQSNSSKTVPSSQSNSSKTVPSSQSKSSSTVPGLIFSK